MADDKAEPITRDQIAESIRSVRGEVTEEAEAGARKLIPVAVAGGVAILVIAYFIGRRVGTTKSTVVEIRRI
ncbi:MAG: hypothetical protein HOH36_10055 [Acidimicrobiaceae bacterium]|nr:hypothetical protein [Acidimicrobiaceae bacterium]MBT5580177.1 hypothetical protein [Acidimicrobiaceae bacterium]MBT5850768.1 hypothetical protein [Acidimicrobiaceae bacterium]